MKTLTESLFDKDIEKTDLRVGNLYDLSSLGRDNMFSNDPDDFINIFTDKAKNKKIEFADPKNDFIKYWEDNNLKGITSIIDIILCMPISLFTDQYDVMCERNVKKYLKPFIKPNKYNNLSIFLRRKSKFNDEINNFIEFQIFDDIASSYPNMLKITLNKK